MVQHPRRAPRYAFVGVRACDLAAIAMLNGVLGKGTHPDQGFVGRLATHLRRRGQLHRTRWSVFLRSMNTGPAVGPGYDLALTERIDDESCHYVVDVGSDDGADVLAALPHSDADDADIDSARADVAEAAHHMGRQMPAVTSASC